MENLWQLKIIVFALAFFLLHQSNLLVCCFNASTMGGLLSNQMSRTKLDKKRDDLQQLVGDSPKIEITSFTNWGENIKYEQILSCKPTKLADVQVGNNSLHCFHYLL